MHSIDAPTAGASPEGAPEEAGSVAVVAADSFLTLRYRLAGPDGDAVIDTFGGPPATLSLGTGELAPALEAKLIGLAAGTRRSFALAPGEAFGDRTDALVQRLGRWALAEALGAEADGVDDHAAGDVVRFPTPDGTASVAAIVRSVEDDTLVLDFNHPLAGRAATFEVELLAVL